MSRTLVTGANGQVGSDLIRALRRREGARQVVGLDVAPPRSTNASDAAAHVTADVRDRAALEAAVREHDIGTVYHLASLLSASGEHDPDAAWSVNMNGLKHVLDLARAHGLKVFWPSTIAVFGPATPKDAAPQEAKLDPRTMYGVTKVSGELLCRYYHEKYGVDVRSLRYPGLVSYTAPPGGGTTDYAVDIFHAAVEERPYTCFLRADTRLPMMYMPDAVEAALRLMDAPAEQIGVRTSYNVAAMSFRADLLADAIADRMPDFECTFAPDDARQQIADAWPRSLDDRAARADWGWQPAFGLEAMVEDMLSKLAAAQPEGKMIGG